MARIEILKANGIKMTVNNRERTFKKGEVERVYGYNYLHSISELESLFGKIKHKEHW